MIAGCSQPYYAYNTETFVDETTILLRKDLDYDKAFRDVVLVLNKHGFAEELVQQDVGHIRTYAMVDKILGNPRVTEIRLTIWCNFSPNRTQLTVKNEMEMVDNSNKKVRFYLYEKPLKSLYDDLNKAVGNYFY